MPVTDIFVLIFEKIVLLLYAFILRYVHSFIKSRSSFVLDKI
jgi:hypothetical protein